MPSCWRSRAAEFRSGMRLHERLHLPLDVYVVRKLGVPGHAELAMGALANDGTCIVDEKLIQSLRLDEETLKDVIRSETEEIRRREETYRDGRPQADVAGKIVIIVDDGLATGATMRAAATALRRRNPAGIVVAVPVAARQTCVTLREVADRVVCPSTPAPFIAVGLYYENFDQTSDDEVRRLLAAKPGCRA